MQGRAELGLSTPNTRDRYLQYLTATPTKFWKALWSASAFHNKHRNDEMRNTQ